ncbi:hypothetical protein MGSAQ_003082, partial [marine sediment metagenome]
SIFRCSAPVFSAQYKVYFDREDILTLSGYSYDQ